MVTVLSLGGSIVAPDAPDTVFLPAFEAMVRQWLAEDKERKLILVIGGGGPARVYQNAYRAILAARKDGAESQADDNQSLKKQEFQASASTLSSDSPNCLMSIGVIH